MAQEFDGPVTINGTLKVVDLEVTGVTSHFNNIFAFGTIQAASGFPKFSTDSVVPNATDHILRITGGLMTSGGITAGADFVVQGTGHFAHDIEVKGDIHFTNAADCAEDFTIAPGFKVDPGTVVVLGSEGSLYPSETAYDKRVVGVVSGAGDYRPGIVLDRKITKENRQPVALVGKVYCNVDADLGSIEIGDLLTTSPTTGHAMRATDPSRAFGAVIGKALRALSYGRGLIPILIALQ